MRANFSHVPKLMICFWNIWSQ